MNEQEKNRIIRETKQRLFKKFDRKDTKISPESGKVVGWVEDYAVWIDTDTKRCISVHYSLIEPLFVD